MNQFNALLSDKQDEPPREWNSQSPEDHFKSSTSPPKTSPVVSSIMERLNNDSIDNSSFNVQPSMFPF